MINKLNSAIRTLEALAVDPTCPTPVLEALLAMHKAVKLELAKPRISAKGLTLLNPVTIRRVA